ncbi:GyrI-like domain-containing protein [Mesobacillus subterraneus]|uniref:AraC family transcriptional regulator n=1 Tax=Mesobacillus subterraneus TaxID=285983 RepID=A0A3R9EET4_9BACI|nr:GyrI-like domain-containing protein [Mesobacillus subterraneus]RSD28783.1 AraC family transcriptional regulator [Mesobacillus subterraneus]
MAEIKQLPEVKLVGFRVLCPGEQYIEEIPKASLRLADRLSEIKNVVNPSFQYGAFIVDAHSEEEDGYWVCAEVSDFDEVPASFDKLIIPAQTYAVCRHKGANHKIRDSYEELHKWMKEQKHKRLMDKWHMEIFRSWSDPENLDVELWDTVAQ